MWILRAVFISLTFLTAGFVTGWRNWPAIGAATVLVGLAALADRALRGLSIQQLACGAGGVLAGLGAAALLVPAMRPAMGQESPILAVAPLLLAFLGLITGGVAAESLQFPGRARAGEGQAKILDTSVIIDGRIADVVQAGFIEGMLIIPQFVLRELQLVADSADSLKRNRGRRGLDVVQRLQKIPRVIIVIAEEDFPGVRDVDMKLIELARVLEPRHRAVKIVTNDFNLNKVAQVRGVSVLNINELANTLKPVVLPGEMMRVFILKEGKEQTQGVAYLDDGTMVVVDNARRLISKTIDITVTSVLQTTAGKMIFGKHDDRIHAVHEAGRQTDHGRSSDPGKSSDPGRTTDVGLRGQSHAAFGGTQGAG
jgi:uncharacterized protein YacL